MADQTTSDPAEVATSGAEDPFGIDFSWEAFFSSLPDASPLDAQASPQLTAAESFWHLPPSASSVSPSSRNGPFRLTSSGSSSETRDFTPSGGSDGAGDLRQNFQGVNARFPTDASEPTLAPQASQWISEPAFVPDQWALNMQGPISNNFVPVLYDSSTAAEDAACLTSNANLQIPNVLLGPIPDFAADLDVPTPKKRAPRDTEPSENQVVDSEAYTITPASNGPTFVITQSNPSTRLEPAGAIQQNSNMNLVDHRQSICEDGLGRQQGVFQTLGTKRKVRSAFDDHSRQMTAKTRSIGACIRCRGFKLRCVQGPMVYEACEKCSKVNPVRLRMPCFRTTIKEAALFRLRPASGRFRRGTQRDEIFALAETATNPGACRQLQLTQDMGMILTVFVTSFTRRSGDKTAYAWKDDANIHEMEMPHYYLGNIEQVKSNMAQYFDNCSHNYLHNFLDGSNEIIWDTFTMAIHFDLIRKGSMVGNALKMWVGCRALERRWRMCGNDTLGLQPIWKLVHPWSGIVPVTPTMDIHLDQIVIQTILIPLKDKLLHELQEKVCDNGDNRRENWFDIYLTIFVLLNNTERLLSHSYSFAKKFAAKGRYTTPTLAESYFHAAKTFLAHFHFACQGSVPLDLDWTSRKARKLAVLDAEQREYMKRMKRRISEKKEAVLDLRSGNYYESDLYWCHQMFFGNWKPGTPHIVDKVT